MNELGKRAVACKAWRELEGMAGVDECGTSFRYSSSGYWVCLFQGEDRLYPTGEVLPDFTDPLTALALLVLVREAYKMPSMFVRCEHDGLWRVCWSDGKFSTAVLWAASAKTEVEALLNALEVAPCEETP